MRQAVVLIHGIGEQQPMSTLRPFVKAILPTSGEAARYYSKPDRMSELFELRQLQAAGTPKTDFYEYYWAYNVQETRLWDLLFWLGNLLVRRKRDVPKAARGLWRISRLLVLAATICLIGGGFAYCGDWYEDLKKFGIVWLSFTAAITLIELVFLAYLGDAARYLSPPPRNIKLRQTIRQEGLKLLRTLHESNKYDRIIIVGHSLGSVIGYDLIKHLWQDYHDQLPALTADRAVGTHVISCMASNSTPQPVIRDEISKCGEALASATDRDRPHLLAAFQQCQAKAWREQVRLGNPWLITDFITLGSPLAHAMMLLAASASDFDERKQERDLLTCPPHRDRKSYAYSGKTVDVTDGAKTKRYTPLVLHHGAPFAVTRWTNLYFPAKLGLFGDIVGGPLAPDLGKGIKDVPVTTRRGRGMARFTLASHTSYWLAQDREKLGSVPSDSPLPSLYAVNEALSLQELATFVIASKRNVD